MYSGLDLKLLLFFSLNLITIAKDPLEDKVLFIKNTTSYGTTNKLLPNKYVLNATVIDDNSVKKTPATNYAPTALNSSTIIISRTKHSKDATNYKNGLLGRTFVSTAEATKMSNFSTVAPHHHKSNHSYTSLVLQYTLIPLGCILFFVALVCMIRHIQRVKKKRRLERELLHQYSYPNSEAGDLDEEERFLEVESVVNTQFHISSDQEEKNFVDEIPQVSVAIGEGSKLIMQDAQSLAEDDVEASTSFNC